MLSEVEVLYDLVTQPTLIWASPLIEVEDKSSYVAVYRGRSETILNRSYEELMQSGLGREQVNSLYADEMYSIIAIDNPNSEDEEAYLVDGPIIGFKDAVEALRAVMNSIEVRPELSCLETGLRRGREQMFEEKRVLLNLTLSA